MPSISKQPDASSVFPPSRLHQDALAKLGYSELNPLQRQAVSEGFLESPRTLVCAPTASGKTLLALLAMVTHFASSNQPVFYVVPLRALASEKHGEFKQSLASFGKTVGLSTGDFDSSSTELGGFDVLIMTSEKLDSLLRHDKTWLERVGLFIFDEIHLLADGSRGATLEMVLTKVKRSEAKILGLSATVANADALAQWLGAKLIQSDYRPTPLVVGLCDGGRLHMEDGPVLDVTEPAVLDLAKLALKEKNGKGQALFFVATRPSTQSLAKQLAPVVRSGLTPDELAQCKVLSEKVLKALPVPTSQCRLLAECVAQGVAFHNAGIEGTQRHLVEEAFKHSRCVKIIVATTTLAVGLDMPASWVVVRDIKRFSGTFSDYMTKMEVSQMCLPGHYEVLTEDGSYRSIAELVNHKEPIRLVTINEKTKKTEFKRVLAWHKNNATELSKIEVDGGVSLELTGNHPVYVIRENGRPNWIPACEITCGDKLGILATAPDPAGVPFMLDYFDDVYVLNSFSLVRDLVKRTGKTFKSTAAELGVKFKTLKGYAYNKAIPLPLLRRLYFKAGASAELEDDVRLIKSKSGRPLSIFKRFPAGFFWLVGLIAAEGSVVNYSGRGRWVSADYQKVKIANGNRTIFLKIKNQLDQLGVTYYERKTRSGFNPDRYFDSLEICNQAFSRLLNKFGLLGGRKTHSISAPANVFRLPNGLVAEYLAGLFDGDGNLNPETQNIRLCLKSKRMIYDTKKLLTRFGIFSQVSSDKHGSWWLSLSAIHDTNLFAKHIPCVRLKSRLRAVKRMTRPVTTLGDLYFRKVVGVSSSQQKQVAVYNLTLEDNPNYVSEGIVVHNCGRAGRPKFDTKGTAVLMCQPRELRAVRDKYVFGKLEDLYSQLSSEPTLRFHALALVASGYAGSFEKLFEFFHSTFYAHQYGDVEQLLAVVEKVVGQLKEMDFVREKKGLLIATPAGKRVAELYVDPLSAHAFIQSMGRKLDELGFLMVLQNATESRPLLSVKRAEEQLLWDEWFEQVAGNPGADDDEALARFKSAKLLQAWISEKTEDQIFEGLDVPPGVVHARVKIQEWLAYSYAELAYLLNQSTALSIARPMRTRLQYGVKNELLPLIAIRGVGRVRARRLFDKGITTKEQAEELGEEKLKELWKESGANQDETGVQTKFGR